MIWAFVSFIIVLCIIPLPFVIMYYIMKAAVKNGTREVLEEMKEEKKTP